MKNPDNWHKVADGVPRGERLILYSEYSGGVTTLMFDKNCDPESILRSGFTHWISMPEGRMNIDTD